ncbi:MAG: (Fe-S)-binding protein [Tannerellaceae bacterium]|jgi:L-lactate dehydrogenase complex protein LldE|nr:(Fe-S)-binding protein [Tannerellaceae bacterium]
MKIGLFIPCYVNAIYPEVGVAMYRLLDALNLEIDYPSNQTCCGQPMANAGFERDAARLAEHFGQLFGGYDCIVAPSASCVAFVRNSYGANLKIYDLCEFLHDILAIDRLPARFPHKVSVHNSCHGVRELGLSAPSERNVPRFSKIKNLLSLVEGIEVYEPLKVDECCGFGGMFSIEESAVSVCMGRDKLKDHLATGAEFITGADSSCLMHLQGIARRENLPLKFIHIAQILSSHE